MNLDNKAFKKIIPEERRSWSPERKVTKVVKTMPSLGWLIL